MAWYDAINPWAGRDVGSRGDYAVPGYADRAAGLQRAYQGAYGPDRQSSFRGDQQALAGRLRRVASGEDSLSRAQLQQSYGQATANQLGLAASARPGQGPMAARLAAQNVGRMHAGMAGDQALAGIAERNAATGQLAGVLGQARGQDIGQLQTNDAFNQAMRQQELQNADLQQRGNVAYQGALAAQPSMWERTAALVEGGAKAYAGYATGGASTAADGQKKMAEGGVVTRPTRALIGEAGPEAVIPLHKLPDVVERLSAMMDRRGGGGHVAARTKQTARRGPAPRAAELAVEYGPPASAAPTATYGPPAPIGPPTWRPTTSAEYDLYKAGVDAAGMRRAGQAAPIFQGGVPKNLTVGEWTAYLRGMGMQ